MKNKWRFIYHSDLNYFIYWRDHNNNKFEFRKLVKDMDEVLKAYIYGSSDEDKSFNYYWENDKYWKYGVVDITGMSIEKIHKEQDLYGLYDLQELLVEEDHMEIARVIFEKRFG